MSKIKFNLALICLGIISLISIAASGWALTSSNKINAVNRGKCTNDCPDGTKVSCQGRSMQTIDDPKDPGCMCDGKEFRCSDKNSNSNAAANTNPNPADSKKSKKSKKNKKNKKKINDNSNSANANVPNNKSF